MANEEAKLFVAGLPDSISEEVLNFRTKGGADSVGRQTTRSVVQSIFLVIVADAPSPCMR